MSLNLERSQLTTKYLGFIHKNPSNSCILRKTDVNLNMMMVMIMVMMIKNIIKFAGKAIDKIYALTRCVKCMNPKK